MDYLKSESLRCEASVNKLYSLREVGIDMIHSKKRCRVARIAEGYRKVPRGADRCRGLQGASRGMQKEAEG